MSNFKYNSPNSQNSDRCLFFFRLPKRKCTVYSKLKAQPLRINDSSFNWNRVFQTDERTELAYTSWSLAPRPSTESSFFRPNCRYCRKMQNVLSWPTPKMRHRYIPLVVLFEPEVVKQFKSTMRNAKIITCE